MPTIFELQEQMNEARSKANALYQSFPTKKLADGQEARDIPADKVGELREMNDAMTKIADDLRALQGVDEMVKQLEERGKQVRGDLSVPAESIGLRIAQTPDLRNALKSGVPVDMDVRTLMTTTAGFAPFVQRESTVVPGLSYPLGLLPYVQIVPTGQNSTKYMKQTTRTISANPKAQGVSADEATVVYTETTSPIQTISVYIPISLEQLEDESGLQALVENDLMLGCRQSLDYEITAGTGTSPSLTGVLNASGKLTYAKTGSDSNFDAILKGLVKVETAGGSGGRGGRFAAPNLLLMNPTDMQLLQLTRTADGVYILGNPGNAPFTQVWGCTVAKSLNMTAGTVAALDTSFMRVRLRKDATIYMTDSDDSDFKKRIIKLRCDIRAGFEIWSDEAICAVTGIA